MDSRINEMTESDHLTHKLGILDEESFKRLKIELIKATLIGSIQKRELVFQDQRRPNLKVYIYKEPNHKRPHVHIYFGNDQEISVCIKTRESLAGSMETKLLKPTKSWVAEHEVQLLKTWGEIQLGEKPELLWAYNT